jgi:hypothetical protein
MPCTLLVPSAVSITQRAPRFFELCLCRRSDGDAAREINKGGYHLLVDLNGWMPGARAGILAMRPVFVQIGYKNFVASGGAGSQLPKISTLTPEPSTPFLFILFPASPHFEFFVTRLYQKTQFMNKGRLTEPPPVEEVMSHRDSEPSDTTLASHLSSKAISFQSHFLAFFEPREQNRSLLRFENRQLRR